MNQCFLVVRLLEKPKLRLFSNNINVVVMIVETLGVKKVSSQKLRVVSWGKADNHINRFYSPGDYIILQGSITLLKQRYSKNKFVQVRANNIYPYVLSFKSS